MLYIVLWVVLSILVALYAFARGHSTINVLGFLLLGLVFSPVIAFIAAALIAPSDKTLIEKGLAKKCPHCAELIKPEAEVCSHCGFDLGRAEKCPHCAELIRPEAEVCSHCGRDVTA